METTQEDFYNFKADHEELAQLAEKITDIEGVLMSLKNQHMKLMAEREALKISHQKAMSEFFEKWCKKTQTSSDFYL